MQHLEHQPDPGPEHEPWDGHEQQPEANAPVTAPAVETGVAAVDEVLAGLDGLEDRPVSEHVAVFEQAHQRLRRVLDGNPDPSPDTSPDPGDGG